MSVVLAEIARSIDYGVTASAKAAPVGPQFLRITDIQDARVDWGTVPFCETSAREEAAAKLVPGDIVFARTGATTGKSFLLRECPERAVFASYLIRVRPDASRVEPRYLAWFFQTPQYWRQITSSASGTAQPGVNASKLKSLEVPILPPLAEQRRIADILDKADAIRRKRKEAIGLTEELLRSAFLDMFGDPVTNPKGWPVKPLGDVADIAGGLQVTSRRASNPISMPYLRVANVYRDRLDLSEIKEMRVTEAERARATLRDGDVLIVEGHGNPEELGRSAVWRDEIEGCTHQNHLIRARATTGVLDAIFLSAFLNSSSGKRQMLALGKTTSGLNTISTNNVRSVQVVLPPLKRQVSYAEVVARVTSLEETMLRRSAGDEALFNSLVARAFSGARSS